MKAKLKKNTMSSALAAMLAVGCAVAVANDQSPNVNARSLAPETALQGEGTSGFSADAMKALNLRIAKAARIAQQIRESGSMDDANFMSLSQTLLGASEAELDAAASASSYKGALVAMRGAKAGAKTLGELSRDFVFYPITPCRLLDTRAGAGLRLTAGVAYGVDFDGGNDGNAAGCTFAGVASQVGGAFGTPVSRAALVLNVTVTQPLGPGHIRVRPVGSTSTASTQNFTTGQTIANMAIVQDADTADEFELWASIGTHAIVDVLGMFAPPAATALDCVSQAQELSAASGARVTSTQLCPAGYTVAGGGVDTCGPTGNCLNDSQTLNASAPNIGNTGWFASITNNSGGTKVFQFQARCCRTPGR